MNLTRTRLGILLFIAVFITGVFAFRYFSDTPPSSAKPHFKKVDCWFEIPEDAITCGHMWVPENREKQNSRLIRFPVAIYHTYPVLEAKPDPVVLLGGGGPGGPVGLDAESAPFWGESFDWLLSTGRDLIMIDQRGVGLSHPRLSCPQIHEASRRLLSENLDAESENRLLKRAARQCKNHLTNMQIDLSAYHTKSSAADIEDLRVALGYEQWNLYGISYAGRLALAILRDFPGSVRSIILDSALPFEAHNPYGNKT
ncbi:MAG: alpha/beta fold hydrolase, partial [Pseudomonadota bacterium]